MNIIDSLSFFLLDNTACVDTFDTQAALLIRNSETPKDVKDIFQNFINLSPRLKECIGKGDVSCLTKSFRDVGVATLEQAVEDTKLKQPKLSQASESMKNVDAKGVAEFEKLTTKDGKEAAKIACNLLIQKSEIIRNYLPKNN